MTTKPKTRKAPVETAAPKPAPNEAAGEPKREVSEISRLVARWRWLLSDQAYQASITAIEKESERLIAIHNDEQEKIENQLATLVPESFLDVHNLLEFATDMVEEGGRDDLEIAMLRNVRKGLYMVRRNEMEAERAEIGKACKEAVEEAENKMCHEVRWAIETKEWKEAQVKEFRARLAANREAA